jgi:monoamine oxidase
LPPGSGTGQSVLILGAGIAGLAAAYELNRAGYDCVVLEAQPRAGGRVLTVRRGDTITEATPDGVVTQECRFDEGLHLDLSGARISHQYRRVLRYCKQLAVPLEVHVPESTANLVHTSTWSDGEPKTNRQVKHDVQGRLAELLAQVIGTGGLSDELVGDDRDAMLDLLRAFGDLDPDGTYQGSTRSGCVWPSTVLDRLQPLAPLTLTELLAARFWEADFYQPAELLSQPTVFQSVGGGDTLVKRFTQRIGNLIRHNAVVTDIIMAEDSVEVTWQEGDASFTRQADYCLSTIPAPVLRGIPANFSDDFADAINTLDFEPAVKVGWQANSRFWESEEHGIHGGTSRIDHPIGQISYPSSGFLGDKGALTGAESYGDDALDLGSRAHSERLRVAKEGASNLHPEFGDESVVPTELGLSIAWQYLPYQRGAWARWQDTAEHRKAYARMLWPDGGRFFVMGDQATVLAGTKEGALMSVEHVLNQVAGTVPVTPMTVAHAPDTRSLTQGRAAPRT